MRRSVYIVSINIIVSIILIVILANRFVYSANKRNAIIPLMSGKVLIKRGGEEKWQTAEIGMALFEKDSIKTMLQSTVILRFDNNTMVKLGSLTTLTLNKLFFRKDTKDTNSAVLDMKEGRMWTRAQKLNLRNEHFVVNTPTASAGVRGTYFLTKIEEDFNTVIDVYEGKIDITRRDKPPEKVSISENQRTLVGIGKGPTLPMLIPEKELEEGKKEFPEELYERCKYDIKINIMPETIKVGEIAVVAIQLLKDGKKYDRNILFKVSLGGSAKFVDNMSQYIEVMSDENGYVRLKVTDEVAEKIKVNVDVQLIIKK